MRPNITHDIRCDNSESERGFAIVIVLVIIMTLTVLAVGVLTSSTTNTALSRNFEKNTQAVNMSEIGVKVAYREFINYGFLKTTHTLNGAAPATGSDLLETSLSNYYVDADGDFVWEWDEGSGHDPMWDTDEPHGFRFRVYYTSSFAFLIECDGWYGTIRKRTRARGEIESMFQFSYFSADNMGEFARAGTQTVTGKVHSNGNLYLCPSGGTTIFNTSSLTASGLIFRSRDAFNRPDTGGTVQITKNSQDSGDYVVMDPGVERGSEGEAFESLNPLWNDRTNGAHALWGGVVRDRVPYKSPPPIQNLDTGQYYDQNAGLHIDASTHSSKGWCTPATIPNWAEQMDHGVQDIDVGALNASVDWPANGLIYCSTMIRLSNAETLASNLMVVSNSTIYTHGNFNIINKKSAALMTKHRVYILSGAWDDNDVLAYHINRPDAVDTTIKAAIVDGIPQINAYNYVDLNNDGVYDDSSINIYFDWNDKTAALHIYPPNKDNPWGPVDDLLEDWGSGSTLTLTKLGSTVHLGGAEMATSLDNSDILPGQLAWVRKRGYWWPIRNYTFDPDLADPVNQPPYTPLIGHITSWAPF